MIEAVILAALGFLVATALWLMLLPALSNRADRLARRRAELSFPISVDEISAERDHLRAEFAVRQRELERRMEEHQSQRTAALTSVGGLDMQISELKTTIGVRDFTVLDLETNLTSTRAELADTQARLAEEQAGHAATRDVLAERVLNLADRDTEIAALRIERADLTATLAARVRDLGEATDFGARMSANLARTSGALSSLQGEHTALQSERQRLSSALNDAEALAAERGIAVASLQQRVAALDAKLATEQAGHATTQSAFEQRGTELGALRAERESLRQRLKASDDTVVRLDQTLTDLRSGKATSDANTVAARKEVEQINGHLRKATEAKARIDVEAASARRESDARVEALRVDLATAQDASASGRAERSALKQELSQLRRDAERAALRLDAENSQLRAEILKVADQFLGLRSGAKPAAFEQDKSRTAPALLQTTTVSAATPQRNATTPGRRQSRGTSAKAAVSSVPDRPAE